MGIKVVGKTVNNQGNIVGYTLTNCQKEVFFTPDNLRNYLQMNNVDNCSILGNDFKITGSLWVRTLSPQKNETPDNPLIKYIKSQNSQFVDLHIRVNTKTFEFTQIQPQVITKEVASTTVVPKSSIKYESEFEEAWSDLLKYAVSLRTKYITSKLPVAGGHSPISMSLGSFEHIMGMDKVGISEITSDLEKEKAKAYAMWKKFGKITIDVPTMSVCPSSRFCVSVSDNGSFTISGSDATSKYGVPKNKVYTDMTGGWSDAIAMMDGTSEDEINLPTKEQAKASKSIAEQFREFLASEQKKCELGSRISCNLESLTDIAIPSNEEELATSIYILSEIFYENNRERVHDTKVYSIGLTEADEDETLPLTAFKLGYGIHLNPSIFIYLGTIVITLGNDKKIMFVPSFSSCNIDDEEGKGVDYFSASFEKVADCKRILRDMWEWRWRLVRKYIPCLDALSHVRASVDMPQPLVWYLRDMSWRGDALYYKKNFGGQSIDFTIKYQENKPTLIIKNWLAESPSEYFYNGDVDATILKSTLFVDSISSSYDSIEEYLKTVGKKLQNSTATERISASELSVGSSKLDSVFGNAVKNTVESTILKDSCIFPKAWTRSTWEITGIERSKIFNRMCICRDKLIDAIKNKGSLGKSYPDLGKILGKWSKCDIVDLNSLKGNKIEILKDNSAIMRDLVVSALKGSCTTGVAVGNKSEWWYTSPMKLNNFPSVVNSTKQSMCYMPVVTIGDKPKLTLGYCYELECLFLTDDKNTMIPLVSEFNDSYFMHCSCFLTELKTPITQDAMIQQLGSLGIDVKAIGDGVEIPSLGLCVNTANSDSGTMHTDCVIVTQDVKYWYGAFNNTGSVLLPFSLVKAYVKESIKI